MFRSLFAMIVIGGLSLAAVAPTDAWAGGRHYRSGHRVDGPKVKGFVQRRGGYSYNYADSINTYGNSRTLYGGASVYRDPNLDRQTQAGPFDHGFFFDSGMGTHGGDSPYMN